MAATAAKASLCSTFGFSALYLGNCSFMNILYGDNFFVFFLGVVFLFGSCTDFLFDFIFLVFFFGVLLFTFFQLYYLFQQWKVSSNFLEIDQYRFVQKEL